MANMIMGMGGGLAVMIGAHAPYRGQLFDSSAKRMGLHVVKYAEGIPWPGNFRDGKTVPQFECVRALPDSVTHVLFADAWDSLCMAGEVEILAKYNALAGSGVVISGEKNCYPESGLKQFYPHRRSPWNFCNSGGFIGRKQDVLKALEWCCNVGLIDDQLCWSILYLSRSAPLQVDEGCQIFQTMNRQMSGEFRIDGDRVQNTVTGTRPCVVHWPGPWHSEPHMALLKPFIPGMVTHMDAAAKAGYVGIPHALQMGAV